MATNAQITKINAQNFHFDDKWVTPRSDIRRKRMQHRKVGKLRSTQIKHWNTNALLKLHRVKKKKIFLTQGA